MAYRLEIALVFLGRLLVAVLIAVYKSFISDLTLLIELLKKRIISFLFTSLTVIW
jgi:uncharacterized membrane protein YqhA